jgi:uncharacterized protein (UPF0276 family)
MLTTHAGIGLRFPHYQEILEKKPDIGWLEVHSENFFGEGRAHQFLLDIRAHYPISLHGVGLSLGSATEPDVLHLQQVKDLMAKVEPFLVSEHLSWSRLGKTYFPDLLPIPYTDESFAVFSDNIQKAQDYLKCTLLIENPSSYITFQDSTWEESDFLVGLAQKTGAKLLLDVNNVFVSSMNHGWDPVQYIQKIPSHFIREIHVAGHSTRQIQDFLLHIDSHDKPVCSEVWDLYRMAIQHCGIIPTLLEWDDAIPSLTDLLAEAQKIKHYAK